MLIESNLLARRQRGVKMNIERLFVPGQALGQTGALLAIAEKQFQLESSLVNSMSIRQP